MNAVVKASVIEIWVYATAFMDSAVREGCSERLQLNCNYPAEENLPYGRWVVSICPAYCDTSRALCFCGEGTKYPNRPAPESCGFKINEPSEPGGPRLTDWGTADRDIFTTNSSIRGWCNVYPAEGYAANVSIKEESDCSKCLYQLMFRAWILSWWFL
ncbi:hypothetical protein OROMI_019491 [Orobanche minor]